MKVLAEVIKTLEGNVQSEDFSRHKHDLLEELKHLAPESYENRGTIYYYLLRVMLQGELHFESPVLHDYFEKMVHNFRKQEKAYRDEIRKHKQKRELEYKVKQMQAKAFYKIVEKYFASLELLYGKRDLHEPKERAYLQKMYFRKHSFRVKRNYSSHLAYVILEKTSNYGTSFVRWGITTLLFILFFGWIFLVIDTIQTGGMMVHGGGWYDYFYFSIVSFTTVGFGDITPVTVLQKILVGFEVLSGYVMLGMLINLIQKKL